MKAIKLLFLFFPFVACAMKIESPYQDQFRAPESRPGSPELLRHVSHELKKYAIAKQTLEDMRSEFFKLKINVENLNKVINILPKLPLSSIMYDLYLIIQIHLKQPNVLAQNISNILNEYLK